MTHETFVKSLEGYYGSYPRPVLRRAVLDYVASEYTEAHLDVLYREIVLTYSGQYRHTPDIAVMEKAKAEVNSRSALKQIGHGKEAWMRLPESTENEMTPEERASALGELAGNMAERVRGGTVSDQTRAQGGAP
jgi:hypothetical protein